MDRIDLHIEGPRLMLDELLGTQLVDAPRRSLSG
jgi:hypothetical protein